MLVCIGINFNTCRRMRTALVPRSLCRRMRTAMVSLNVCQAASDVAVLYGRAGLFGRTGGQARLVGRQG